MGTSCSVVLSEDFNQTVTSAPTMCPENARHLPIASTEVCLLYRSTHSVFQREKQFLLLSPVTPPGHFNDPQSGCLIPDTAIRAQICHSQVTTEPRPGSPKASTRGAVSPVQENCLGPE